MGIVVARERGEALDEALAGLLPGEPYLAFANFPPIGERAVALHRGWWTAAADALGVLVARDDSGRVVGAVRLERREFESAHFGMAIGKIDPPIAVADEVVRRPVLHALYGAAWEALRGDGYAHCTALASTQDRVACWSLQEHGGFHVGTKISWMQALMGDALPALPPPLRFETYERTAIAQLPRASWQRLCEWTGSGFDRGPFVFDLDVPGDRAAALYRVWSEKAFTGEWADALLVVRDGDEVVAFHSMLLLPELSEAAGVGILGRGIGATLPGYRGLFTALQQATAAARPLGAAWLENETQTSTIATINVFGKLGHRCLRSTAEFHAPLARDAAPGDAARRR
jgi:hypothetical protein